MKLLKPSWVNHDDKPIFSVDIHPTGKRFATGGQGGDSGRIVVWNLNPVLFESIEMDPNVPKMLCQMDNHLACVNCVRWSNNGRYLASGGDDRLVMVWALSGAAATPGSKVKGETWRCVSTLRGHAGDVLDLAWSPLDKWLASCSVDNSIIIWNAEKFPEMVYVLNGHTGLVKGVAWDPVGKYLASQSDDKSLRVWKTADWGQEAVVTEPFEECGGTTHVLRLSWSPDGQYVVSAHAMNGGGPTAQVVERNGWRCDKDFVGHRKAVTCARFNSNILMKDGKKCCCAGVGSRDRSLSIWLTSLKRPLVVVHDLFADSVLDISWSADGLNLLACSSDGSVACIQFTNKEIGTPISMEEKNAFYEKNYGKCLTSESSGVNPSSLLLECPEIILAREKDKAKKDNLPKNENSQSSQWSRSAPPSRRDRQIETRTSDGKRRITPVFIPDLEPSESLGPAPEAFSTSSQSKSRILVERRDDIVIPPNVSNVSMNSNISNTSLTPTKIDEGTNQAPALRKRAATTLPGPRTLDLPYTEPKRQATNDNNVTVATSVHGPLLPVPVLGTAGPIVRAAGQYRVQVLNNSVSSPYGKLSRLQLLPINSASSDPVWETYLGSCVSCIACCARGACVCCADRTLHAWTWTPNGARRALPPIALPSRASRLWMSRDVILVVTETGHVCAWPLPHDDHDKHDKHAPFTINAGHLITPNSSVTNATLLDDGSPLISFSNGKTYIYCKDLSSWVVWQDGDDACWRAGRGARALHAAAAAAAAALYPAATPAAAAAYRQHNMPVDNDVRVAAALSWTERAAAAAAALRRPRDYRHWTLATAQHLAEHGTEKQLRNILDEMLGPSHGTSTPKHWQSTILGHKKHDLLEEMLAILVRNLRWQRLYTEYSEQLNDLKAANSNSMNITTNDSNTNLPTTNGVVNGH